MVLGSFSNLNDSLCMFNSCSYQSKKYNFHFIWAGNEELQEFLWLPYGLAKPEAISE